VNGFHKTIAALAAIGAAGVSLCFALPLEEAWRLGAIGGVLVSIAGAIPAVMLHARAMAPAAADQAMKAMAVGVRAMAAAMVIRFGFCGIGLFVAMKVGASGAAFATGFFGVYFALQAAEARWLLIPSETLRGDAT
jgi:uncharacterized membrane protein